MTRIGIEGASLPETFEELVALAKDVRYAQDEEERAIIAFERLCFDATVDGKRGMQATEVYGQARRILRQRLQWGRERCPQCGNPIGFHKPDCGALAASAGREPGISTT